MVMGTVVAFEVRHRSAGQARPALGAAVEWLHWVDATFSTYRTDSEISRLDRGELSESDCHAEVRHVLALCEDLRVTTSGFFDARASGRLDPSGVVKGWAVERASEMLTGFGCPDHLIDGGGDVRVHGSAGEGADWQIGVVHPFRLDAYCAALHLGRGAVATSGTYQRGFHVLDPTTGRPAMELAAVTVVGPDLTRADAYATAALAMGPSALSWLDRVAGFEALIVGADGRGWETSGFGHYRLDVAA
jgi:thiamine biosynthesis lipoprotein